MRQFGERRSSGSGYGRYDRPRSGGFGGGRGMGGRSMGGGSFEKPVKEGEVYDVEIVEVGSKGDGIAKIKNFIIFVANTKKGDKVKIRITLVRAKSAVAEVVGGAEASAESSEPASETAGETEGAEESVIEESSFEEEATEDSESTGEETQTMT